MDDKQIINDILNGNKNAFSLLMDKYHNEIFKYIYNMTKSYETTEDLMQDIFMKLYNNLKKYNPNKASFRTWMYRISMHHTMNYFNKAQTRCTNQFVDVDDLMIASGEDIENDVIKEKQIDEIIRVIKNKLKPKHQNIMLLHYFSGLDVKEISEVTEIPIKTIYKAIKSSIQKIQEEVIIDE